MREKRNSNILWAAKNTVTPTKRREGFYILWSWEKRTVDDTETGMETRQQSAEEP